MLPDWLGPSAPVVCWSGLERTVLRLWPSGARISGQMAGWVGRLG